MKKLKDIPWKKVLFITLASGLLVVGFVLVWASMIELPDVSTFEARKIANSSKITDRTGEVVLYDIHQSVRRTEVGLAEMSDNVKNAVIAIEDAHFYEHKGIRPTSIIRAVIVNVFKGEFSQGGSTITQQIIKNTLLNTDKTIVRKFKEWILALKIERQFTKDQILQIYLNDAPFGSTIYGVEEASRAFFNKSSAELTVSEAAYLAAMMPAPSYYSPFGQHRDRLNNRKDLVLRKMLEYGYINDLQFEEAMKEKVEFNKQASNSIKAPHFAFYVLDYLQKKYGEDVMESGGYTIKTSLDYTIQKKAEEIVAKHAADNLKRYNVSNSSLVAIDPTTGQILAMVGSKDYFDKTIDGAFNVAIAKRQPGSSFKPFVYATAFAEGYTPETVLFDIPTQFSTSCGSNPDTCYSPDNFDNKFKGPINLRSSIAESRNVPSVKLLYLVGIEDAIKTAHNLGISSLNNADEYYGLSLVLGGGEVSLLDMTSAYGVFANSGLRNPTTGILEVRDRKGNIVEQFEQNATEAMDKNAVLTLNNVLSDPVARTPTFGSSITIPGVAVKTGTTNDNRDAWILGYTPTIAVGVWSGNNNNASMRSGGSTVSGPIWKEFMEEVLKTVPMVPFEEPVAETDTELKPILRGVWMGNETIAIDKITGLRATDNTPAEAQEERVLTNVHDILHWVDKDNPRGPAPENPSRDPQYRLWEAAVQNWWSNNKFNYNIVSNDTLPSDYENIHNTQNATKPVINGLPSSMSVSQGATITVTSTGQYPLTSVDVFINNNYITSLSNPFQFNFRPADYGYQPGTYTVRVVGTNSILSQSATDQTLILTE